MPGPSWIANRLISLVGFNESQVKQIPKDFANYITELSKNNVSSELKITNNNSPSYLQENRIIPITKGRFESFPLEAGFERFAIIDEKEWYEESTKHSLGVLCRDRTDNDWGYAILTKSNDGLYKWSDGEVSIQSRDEARNKLIEKMEGN